MLNALEFVKWGLSHVKKKTVPVGAILPIPVSKVGSAGEWEYLYGSSGERVTKNILDSAFRGHYSKNKWTRSEFDKATKGWVESGRYVCDCQGVEDCFSKSQTNADGNYIRFCTDKGLCSAIRRPYVLGEAVFNGSDSKKTHIGWVCGFLANGDVLVMEERGIAYGFIITRMSKRPWKYRGLMTKRYEYAESPTQPESKNDTFVFTRALKSGCAGEDVKELKKALAKKGYTGLTETNGYFQQNTKKVVMAFQKDAGMTVDGIAGARTYKALGVKYDL